MHTFEAIWITRIKTTLVYSRTKVEYKTLEPLPLTFSTFTRLQAYKTHSYAKNTIHVTTLIHRSTMNIIYPIANRLILVFYTIFYQIPIYDKFPKASTKSL